MLRFEIIKLNFTMLRNAEVESIFRARRIKRNRIPVVNQSYWRAEESAAGAAIIPKMIPQFSIDR